MALTLTITTDESGKKKGRSFSGEVFAYASCNALWEGSGSGSTLRPVVLIVGTSDEEAGPLLENLRAGERALMKGEPGPAAGATVELLRSAGYAFAPQRTEEGTILTAYLPSLFDFQPGLVDADGVRFVLLPAREDLAEMRVGATEHEVTRRCLARLGVAMNEESFLDLSATALLWAVYLDLRCELPIPPESDFRVEMYLAALHQGLASSAVPPGKTADFAPFEHEAFGFIAYIAPGVPVAPAVATKATHEELRTFLAAEIARYDRAHAARRNVRPVPQPGRRARSRPSAEVG
jgi:hypothetical protein